MLYYIRRMCRNSCLARSGGSAAAVTAAAMTMLMSFAMVSFPMMTVSLAKYIPGNELPAQIFFSGSLRISRNTGNDLDAILCKGIQCALAETAAKYDAPTLLREEFRRRPRIMPRVRD